MSPAEQRAISLYGTTAVDPPFRLLKAGPLSVAFDNGGLRYVRVAGIEALRGIAFLVRDENWGTASPTIENLRIDEGDGSFTVTYRATCANGPGHLVYDARIEGRSDGSLSFEAEAVADVDMLTNRTGFIVLHPIDGVAGRPVKVVHEDGSENLADFPLHIDPRCPITGIRSLSHEIAPGLWATCTMEGEAFEMEDQRNWSDASYKTYVRSLKKPWPYTLEAGKRFTQAVRLHVTGPLPTAQAGAGSGPSVLTLGAAAGTMPRIGVGVAGDEAQSAIERPELIRALGPQWLVCQVDLRKGDGDAVIARHATLGRMTKAGVVLEIITRGTMDPFAELEPVALGMRKAGLDPEAVTVFPAQDMVSMQPDAVWPQMPTFAETYAAARKAFPGARLGGGMATYFTELNRKRPPADLLDYVTCTTCPSVHAADDVSVMETLQALPHIIRSTAAFMGEALPRRMGPSQLGCRENPYGKATTPNTANARLCLSRLDPRQRGLFNAAWMVGYAAACVHEGLEALALGGLTGPFGHIHVDADHEQPWYKGKGGRTVYPSFHVVADLARLGGGALRATELSNGEGLAALAVERDGETTLWLANLSADQKSVRLPDATAGGDIAILDAERFAAAASDADFVAASASRLDGPVVDLDAYAVARVRFRQS